LLPPYPDRRLEERAREDWRTRWEERGEAARTEEALVLFRKRIVERLLVVPSTESQKEGRGWEQPLALVVLLVLSTPPPPLLLLLLLLRVREERDEEKKETHLAG
jgi:hypothetical protein